MSGAEEAFAEGVAVVRSAQDAAGLEFGDHVGREVLDVTELDRVRGASSPRRALRRWRLRSPQRHAAFRVMRRKAAIVCLERLLNWVNRLTRLFRLEVTDQSEHVFYGEVWKARTSWPFSWLAKGMRPGVRFRTLQGWSKSGLPVPRPGRLSRESSPAYCTASRGRLNRTCATPSKYAKLALLTDFF